VAMDALHRLGVADPARNFIVASEGALDEDGIPVVVLAKKTAFTAEEESTVRAHMAQYPELTVLYLPSQPENNPFSNLIASNDPYRFAQGYAYNVTPVSDNAPFFFFTLKAGQILGQEGLRRGAWYRIVEEAAQPWIVLDVHQVEVRVPKDNVDIRKDRPKAWSVVHEPHLVCPGCHKRQYVSGQPKDVKCVECGNSFGVEWQDRA